MELIILWAGSFILIGMWPGGKVVYPDWYVEPIVRSTHDGTVTRSHLACRTPDRYVVSPVASRIIVAGARCSVWERYRSVALSGSRVQ